MPWKSKSQRRLCYAKRDPRWDCEEWDIETRKVGIKIENLPERVSKSSSSPKEKTYEGKKVYVGPKGGRYIRKNGKKVYI